MTRLVLVALAGAATACIVELPEGTEGSTTRSPTGSDSSASSDGATSMLGGSTSTGDGAASEGSSFGSTSTDDGTSTGVGTSSGGSTTTLGSTSTSDGSGDSDGSSSDTGDGAQFDPLCGTWSALKTRARGLDRVWSDGMDVIAGGDIDLVHRDGVAWSEHDEVATDHQIRLIADVWGSAVDDHWLLANQQGWGAGVFRFDGTQVTPEAVFTPPPGSPYVVPADLAGSGPTDAWAVGTPSCDTFECFEDPSCSCHSEPSVTLHYDGVAWTPAPSPGLVRRLWTDGAQAWAVGDDFGPGGLIARWDGAAWNTELAGLIPVQHAVWSPGGDEVWSGGELGSLLHRQGGFWSVIGLPVADTVVAIDGRSASEVWALTSAGELWAYDGVSWGLLLTMPEARDFAVLDTGLVAVGEDDGHWIVEVDTTMATTTELYTRSDLFQPGSMVVDDMGSAVASDEDGGRSWRWDGIQWAPTYPALPVGFGYVIGAVDEGWGTRDTIDAAPDAVWNIAGGVPMAIPDPVAEPAYYADPVLVGDVLWVAGRTQSNTHFVYSYEGGIWTDRTPAVAGAYSATNLTTAGGRVFVELWVVGADAAMLYYEGGVWTDIGNPGVSHPLDLVASGAQELWMTGHVSQMEGYRLFHWDGAAWHRADTLWPAIAAEDGWWMLASAAPHDAWVVSSEFFESETLAHWDGVDWTMVATPPELHGWNERQRLLLAPAADGVFIHDGLRLWQYELCPLP